MKAGCSWVASPLMLHSDQTNPYPGHGPYHNSIRDTGSVAWGKYGMEMIKCL